ncbi:hypothetical protein B0H17DRAFT_1216215 [Mycena rosella]|uniref:Uncharacterized protein n=1 Tax=Mycena rosella TaxID=1033263 RepID=A0AAD7CA77_MYCRO|nr:hypothetical protein B0H17DRAFT_1216215 [Mycena rosella]
MYGDIASLLTPAFRFICGSVLRVASTSASSHPAPVHTCYSRPSCATLGYNMNTNLRAAHDTPHLAPCALDLLAAAHVDTPAHSLVVAHVRFPGSGTGCAGPLGSFTLDGTPAHSVLGPSAPRIPPTLLQFRAHAVSAAAQFRPLPALESRTQTPRPLSRFGAVQRAISSLPRAFHPHPRAPLGDSRALASSTRGGVQVQVPPLRCRARVPSNRARPNSPMRATHPCPCRLSFQDARRVPCARTGSPDARTGSSDAGTRRCWQVSATAAGRPDAKPRHRNVALQRRNSAAMHASSAAGAQVPRVRHIPACGVGRGSHPPPSPLGLHPVTVAPVLRDPATGMPSRSVGSLAAFLTAVPVENGRRRVDGS